MRDHTRAGPLVALATAMTMACGSNPAITAPRDAPEPPLSVTGVWAGSLMDYRDETVGHTVELRLQQRGSTVTGQIVSGLFVHPDDIDGEARNRAYPLDGQMLQDGDVRFTAHGVGNGGCFDLVATLEHGLSEPQNHSSSDTRQATLRGEYLVSRTASGCGRPAIGRARALQVMLAP